jgi:two-component system, NarL family, response regulator DegU
MDINHELELILADDHLFFRKTLIAFLETDPVLKVIGEAENGIDLLKLLKFKRPHIVLVDLEMPEMSGIDAIEHIKTGFPLQKIVVLTNHGSSTLMAKMILHGVNGYLLKDCDPANIILTIKKVYKDGYYFSEAVSKQIITAILNDESLFDSIKNQVTLSNKEIRVLELVCKGKTNKEIAQVLQVKEGTIEFHKRNIFKKTYSDSVPALIKYALRKGITNIS